MLTPVYSEDDVQGGLKTKGGILIPSSAQVSEENPIVVTKVVGVGDECKVVKFGDEVIVNRNTVMQVQIGIMGYWFIPEKLLFGILRDTPEVNGEPNG